MTYSCDLQNEKISLDGRTIECKFAVPRDGLKVDKVKKVFIGKHNVIPFECPSSAGSIDSEECMC